MKYESLKMTVINVANEDILTASTPVIEDVSGIENYGAQSATNIQAYKLTELDWK